jgi:hypothetical protein
MSRAVWPMPVSVEQIAVAVRQMDVEERRRLIGLVPDLREALSLDRALHQARESAQALQEEMLEKMRGEYLKPDEPFLGGLTLETYWELSDEERERLWAEWSEEDWDTIEEIDVAPGAMSA